MTDLLPCPFCGGSASVSTGRKGDGTPWDYIECDTLDCGAIAEPDVWNTRASVSQPEVQSEDTVIPGSENMDARFAWLEAKAIDMGYRLVPEHGTAQQPTHPMTQQEMAAKWQEAVEMAEQSLNEVLRLREMLGGAAQASGDCGAWQPLETAPLDPLRDPPLVMLWVDDGGHKGNGTHAFGRCYRSHDGKIRGVASGFSGNWSIRFWMPLPATPSVPSAHCHCGKDGHALNSINCPVHGYTISQASREAGK